MRAAVSLVVLTSLAAIAHADPPPPDAPHPHAGFGGGASVGLAALRGRDSGWVARLDYELFPVLAYPGELGPMFGWAPGLQAWSSGGDWGVGLPFPLVIGVRMPGARAMLQLGFEAFLVDQVDDDTGFGLFAPLAGARVELEVRGWHAGVDARVTRRWQFGADDHTQYQLAFTVGRLWESKLDQPIR